jgi:hypothetical protein
MDDITEITLPSSTEKEQSDDSSVSQPPDYSYNYYNVCPTCKKPTYQYPYQNLGPPKSQKFFGLPIWALVIIFVVILIFGCAIIGFILLSFGPYGPFGPGEYTDTYSTEVIISEGGHFKYSLGYMYDYKIELNISSKNGNQFDVYIMDEDQYENAYGSTNTSILAFSVQYSYENVSQVDDTIEISEDIPEYKSLYLILDNRKVEITPNDADPIGTITVDLNIEITSSYHYY